MSTATSLLDLFRRQVPADLVELTFVGTPIAVAAVARALATVVPVNEMRHHVGDSDDLIRLEATCSAHSVARVRSRGVR